MKKYFLTVLLCLSALTLSACGSSNQKNTAEETPEPKEYIEESQITELFTNPDNFKEKYVTLTGKVFMTPEKDDGTTYLQIYNNPMDYENNFIVSYEGDLELTSDSYVSVDGQIAGAFSGENMMGGSVTAPLILADTVKELSYIEAVVPTISEIVPADAVLEQHGLTLKIDKIEFAAAETRVYLTAENSSEDKCSISTYSMKIIQNSQQIEQDSSTMSKYDGNYPDLSSDILPGASTSGVLVFPALDGTTPFQLYADSYSDNWELQFEPFIFDITP